MLKRGTVLALLNTSDHSSLQYYRLLCKKKKKKISTLVIFSLYRVKKKISIPAIFSISVYLFGRKDGKTRSRTDDTSISSLVALFVLHMHHKCGHFLCFFPTLEVRCKLQFLCANSLFVLLYSLPLRTSSSSVRK
ncbi:uncharacterized protein LOC124899333 [Capsicum annuum]|uniref:uncharacterized protein LOC124899333 n=1 Tax=Capsicum annuum TaxID=4072 RepID=UPI001FB05749|nr:uncharacterized protein LOC124899333 [Capsicum annuum]